jgi:hypothetical protein
MEASTQISQETLGNQVMYMARLEGLQTAHETVMHEASP